MEDNSNLKKNNNDQTSDTTPVNKTIKWNLIHSTRWIIVGFILIITAKYRRADGTATTFVWAAFLFGWFQFFKTLKELDSKKKTK